LVTLALATDRQGIALDGDLHILGLDTRQRCMDHESVIGLGDVDRQRGEAVRARRAPGPDETLLEQRVHRVAEADSLTEGVPTFDRHSNPPFLDWMPMKIAQHGQSALGPRLTRAQERPSGFIRSNR